MQQALMSNIGKIAFLTLCFLIGFLASHAFGYQSENTEKPESVSPLKLSDVFELEFVSDPQVSPDGKNIVYVRRFYDIMTDRARGHIWLVDESGSHQPLLTGESSYSSPRWSPDGKKLLYSTSENGSNQIFCMWMDSGRRTSLTRLTQSPSGISWSPNGEHIAFSMAVQEKPKAFAKMPAKPKGAKWAAPPIVIDRLNYRSDGRGYLPHSFSQIFVVPASGGTPRQLTDGKFNHGGGLTWTPDNKRLLFSANLREDAAFQPANSEIYSLEIDSKKITQLTDRNGPDSSPVVSPDGNSIYYLGYDDKLLGNQNNRLYRMNLDGSESTQLAQSFERSMGSIQWSKSDNGLFFQFDDSGETNIGFVAPDGKTQTVMSNVGGTSLGRPYSSGSFSVADNGAVVFTQVQPNSPSRLCKFHKGHLPEVLVDLNKDLFDQRDLGKVNEINFASSADGEKIQGWYITPPGFKAASDKKYPMILEIHGGPYANYGPRFSAEMQLYAAAGYVVLFINPRGSTSYGERFANLIQHNYPGQDYDDLMSGVDGLIEKGFIDESKLFVTGGSGGGVLTAWIVGKTNRFRAAVVAKPVINWYSFALTADMYNYFYKYWFPGLPWEHTEQYMKRSPISLVGNVKTPTMLLTGEQDFRTPISESEQYYQALKLNKVDTAMVRIPGASHGITARPSNMIAKVAYILEWFERHQK